MWFPHNRETYTLMPVGFRPTYVIKYYRCIWQSYPFNWLAPIIPVAKCI